MYPRAFDSVVVTVDAEPLDPPAERPWAPLQTDGA